MRWTGARGILSGRIGESFGKRKPGWIIGFEFFCFGGFGFGERMLWNLVARFRSFLLMSQLVRPSFGGLSRLRLTLSSSFNRLSIIVFSF